MAEPAAPDLASEIQRAQSVVEGAAALPPLLTSRSALYAASIESAQECLAKARTASTDPIDASDPAKVEARNNSVREAVDQALKFSADAINLARVGGGAGAKTDEWKECRTTIDRFDKLLVDLRKTGFGFVTALVGAASFIFGPDKLNVRLTILVMLVLLIGTLYLIDLAHQSWLDVAVTRAQ